ncbi:MAG: hypothetical protein IT221_03145, partial [Fluviicola sp.]|nr:hypothetical protein [Fluviicola sp.]
MKGILIIAYCLVTWGAVAQTRIHYIEKSEQTQVLFDEESPYSLFAILQNNQFCFEGMSMEAEERILAKFPTIQFSYRYGPQSDIPLTDDFGEPIENVLPDGTYTFIYPEPDHFFIDLNEITGILVLDSLNASSVYVPYLIAFTKKYGEQQAEIVASKSFAAFSDMDGYKIIDSYFQNDKNACIEILLSDIQTYQTKIQEKDLTNARNYEGSPFILFGRFSPNKTGEHEWKYKLPANCKDEFIHEFNWPFRNLNWKKINRDSLWEAPSTIKKMGIESTIPLINSYGEDSLIYMPDGAVFYAYPPRDSIFYWISSPITNCYVLYNMKKTDNSTIISPEAIHLTTTINQQEVVMWSITLEQLFNDYPTSV